MQTKARLIASLLYCKGMISKGKMDLKIHTQNSRKGKQLNIYQLSGILLAR